MSSSRQSRSSLGVRDSPSESKWPETDRYGGSMKDDAKQAAYQLRGQTKEKATQLKERITDAWERTKERAGDAIDASQEESDAKLYSLRSRVINKGADVLEDDVQPTLRAAERQVDRAARALRSAAQREGGEEEEDDDEGLDEEDEGDEYDEEEGGEESAGQNGDFWQKTLKGASDLSSSLRSRLRNAAPQVEDTISRGVGSLKQRVRDMQQDDDELGPEQESGEEEDEEDEGEEGGEQEASLSSTLRSGARRARAQLDEVAPEVQRLTGRARAKVERGVDRVRGAIKSTRELVSETRGRMSGGGRIGSGSDNASSSEAGFDWQQGQQQLKDKAADLQSRGRGWLAGLREKAEAVLAQSSPEAPSSPEAQELSPSPSPSPSPSESGDEVATRGENFSVKLEPVQPVQRRARESGPSLPALLIGSLFTIWLLASAYQHFGHPVEEVAPKPTNLFDAAKQWNHDLLHRDPATLSPADRLTWEKLRAESQKFADLVVGRKPEPTLFERLRSAVWGPPADQHHGLRHGIEKLESSAYRVADQVQDHVLPELRYRGHQAADTLRHAKDSARANMPGMKERASEVVHKNAEELRYHRDHAGDYLHRARESVDHAGRILEEKAQDAGIIRRKTIGQRFWSWLSGEETTTERIQRLVNDGQHRMDELKGDLRDAVHPDRSLGGKVKDGLHSIRSHLPGYQPTAADIAADTMDRARAEAAHLQDSAQHAYHRARGGVDSVKDRAYDLAHEARDRVHQGADNLQAELPHHRSLGNRLKDGLDHVKLRVQDGLHHVKEGLRPAHGGVHEPVPRHDLHHEVHHSTNIHPIAEDAQGVGHIYTGNLPLGEALPVQEVMQEISHAEREPVQVHRETLGERVRHVVHDTVDAIKAHLPGRPHAAPVHPTVDAHHAEQILRDRAADLSHKADAARGDAIHGLHRAGEAVRHAGDSVRHDVRQAAGRVETGVRDTVHGIRRGVDDIKSEAELKLHHARKEAEYYGHRAVHNAEKVGHRIEEKYDEVKDRVQYHMPN